MKKHLVIVERRLHEIHYLEAQTWTDIAEWPDTRINLPHETQKVLEESHKAPGLEKIVVVNDENDEFVIRKKEIFKDEPQA
jgi:hypothetical protein